MSVVPATVSIPALQKAASTSSLVASTESHNQAGYESPRALHHWCKHLKYRRVKLSPVHNGKATKIKTLQTLQELRKSPGMFAAVALLISMLAVIWWKRKRNGSA
jgi:hypothetical protein